MGLNEGFLHVRGQILLLDPIPSVNKVFSSVLQEEKQFEIGYDRSLTIDTTTFLAKKVDDSNLNKQPFRKNRPICTCCRLANHTEDKCYKLHGST